MNITEVSVERSLHSKLQRAFDTAHPCQTVAMATAEREVCSTDKSATGDEGVDRSFWRSLTLLQTDRRLVWEINTVRRWCVEIDSLRPNSLYGSNLTRILLQSVNFRHQPEYFHTLNVCDCGSLLQIV